jgi:hypothetical protein
MAANPQDKVIQVQKPAQSLENFQRSLGDEAGSPALRKILLGACALVAAALGYLGWTTVQAHRVEKFETSLAALRLEVEGDGLTPVAPADLEKRMKDALPRLEALAKEAPGSSRASAEGMVRAWKLELDGKTADAGETAQDPWGRLRQAQRALALGQAKPASDILSPLRPKAGPGEAWSGEYWSAVLQADRLAGDRPQAVKDLAEYKERFKKEGPAPELDKALQGI